MLLLVGAIPVNNLPLSFGKISLGEQGGFVLNGQALDVDRGTAAMITVSCTVCNEFGLGRPMALVAGDIGTRRGSMEIYDYLLENLDHMNPSVMTFHYMMPDIKKNHEVVGKIRSLKKKPILIADAGSMYAAKAGGDAAYYDVFTPDLGEMAFLADEKAMHPTYTRGFIFHLEDDVPELIRRAYELGNAAPVMIVKGQTDLICHGGKIVEKIAEPEIEALEPVGGTGDTITGMVSALIYAGKSPLEACRMAGKANRIAGALCDPTPATQVRDIIKHIPTAIRQVLEDSA